MNSTKACGEDSVHVAVIGAGILGVSTAEWLRRGGARVTLIDRTTPGDPDQASYGNAGLLARCAVVQVPSPGLWKTIPRMVLDPDGPAFVKWSALARLAPWLIGFLRTGTPEQAARTAAALADLTSDAVDQHVALAQGTAAERHIRTGDYLYLYRDRAAFDKDAFGMGLRRDNGLTWEERGRDAITAADPAMGPNYGFAAAFPDHGWIHNPGAYLADLAAHFVSQGGEIRRADVKDVRPGAPVQVITDTGEITADHVVLAGGVWSRDIAQSLGHKTKMQAERGYHLHLHGVNHVPPTPYMLADGKCAVTPMEGGLRIAGTAEFGTPEQSASKAPPRQLERRIKALYPDLTWERAETWMGRRPSTVDSMPMIGPAPKAPNVHFAFGAQHIGLTTGPKTGRLVADVILGRRPNIDLTPFRVGRFD